MVDRLPRLLLHAEGAAVFAAATAVYFREGHPWWLYLLLALAPDLAMLGYAAGARVGAAVYDTVHTYVLPLALGAVGVLANAADAPSGVPDLDSAHRHRPRGRLRAQVPVRLQGHAPAARLSMTSARRC